jgi:di/tricarboxylate transporter
MFDLVSTSNTATATLLLPHMFDLVSTSNTATSTLLLPLMFDLVRVIVRWMLQYYWYLPNQT